MSGALPRPPAPFSAPTSGTIDQKLAEIANAINGKASATHPPAYQFMGLVSPNGTLWRITVDDSGVLHTSVVPR
jgi:hypothetical protein